MGSNPIRFHELTAYSGGGGGGGGFFLACANIGRTFDHSVPACASLSLSFERGD